MLAVEALAAWLALIAVTMVIVGYLATRWGHDPFGWLLLSAAMGPIALAALVATHSADRTRHAPAAQAPKRAGATRILIASDGSAASERLARYVIDLHRPDAEVEVLAVCPYEAEPGESERAQEDARADAERMTARAVAALRAGGLEPEVHVAYGQAAEQILRRAEETRADLVVVGRRGAGMTKALLGSVSDAVVKRATQPVAVVE